MVPFVTCLSAFEVAKHRRKSALYNGMDKEMALKLASMKFVEDTLPKYTKKLPFEKRSKSVMQSPMKKDIFDFNAMVN